MRRIVMTGRLTRDPEFREVTAKDDKERKIPRLTFGIANNDNGKENAAEFFDVVVWDRLATWGQQYLKRGTRIIVCGTPRNESYEADGVRKTHFRIVGEKIELIG